VATLWLAANTRWDWRVSAHARTASLASLWLLIFAGALTGPLLPIIGALRMAASTIQLVLNGALARRRPIARRDRFDWLLLGLAFAGSCTIAAIGDYTNPLLLMLVLVPYSGIQYRSIRRSWAAHSIVPPPLPPLPFPHRLETPGTLAA
jgi:hypothetical protein